MRCSSHTCAVVANETGWGAVMDWRQLLSSCVWKSEADLDAHVAKLSSLQVIPQQPETLSVDPETLNREP